MYKKIIQLTGLLGIGVAFGIHVLALAGKDVMVNELGIFVLHFTALVVFLSGIFMNIKNPVLQYFFRSPKQFYKLLFKPLTPLIRYIVMALLFYCLVFLVFNFTFDLFNIAAKETALLSTNWMFFCLVGILLLDLEKIDVH